MTVLARAFPGWDDAPELDPAAVRLPVGADAPTRPNADQAWLMARHAEMLADLYQGALP